MANQGKHLWLFGLLAVTALVLSACGAQATPTAAPMEEPEAEQPAEAPSVTNAVTVEDQALGADNTVVIASVTSDSPGWLVIHADADGKPGPILGFAPVQAGENADVVVEVDPAAVTETLYAMLHVDAGTKGEFEFPDGPDVPAKDAEGNIVTPAFMLLEEEAAADAVVVEDQALGADNTVVIASVTSDSPGWLVIHANADGKPGPILGFAPVQAGENADVVVEVDPAGATETLYAMLHVDAGTEGEFEFPDGPDVPAKDAEGNIITPAFTLLEEGAMAGEGMVSIEDGRFVEKEITVAVGKTVVWTNNGSSSHTVTADDGSFGSGMLQSGDTFSYTFDQPGTYAYYCEPHSGPGGTGMLGIVNVTE